MDLEIPNVEPQIRLPRDAETWTDPMGLGACCAPDDSVDERQCTICLEGGTDFQLPCSHFFHEKCIATWLSSRSTCPNCGHDYGAQVGQMPDGDMLWRRVDTKLSGYSCGTIVLHFHFLSGQMTLSGEATPTPYRHRSQHAYLPDNEDGRQLLAAFAVAFRRRLLFTLAQSTQSNQWRPVFAISLKTSTRGGLWSNGYPDPNYFSCAAEELRVVGIDPDQVSPVELGSPPKSKNWEFALRLLRTIFI